MSKVAPEVRERLEAEGRWRDFTRVRSDAIREGMKPAEAERFAISQFCPDLSGVKRPSHKSKRSVKADAGEDGVGKDAKPSAETASGAAQVRSPQVIPALAGVRVATPGMFNGKKCSMVAAIDWVIDALSVPPEEVDPHTAPAAKAWSIYLMCRRSISFAEEIITKAVVRQIPNGMRDDELGDGDGWDGKEQYDAIEAAKEALRGT